MIEKLKSKILIEKIARSFFFVISLSLYFDAVTLQNIGSAPKIAILAFGLFVLFFVPWRVSKLTLESTFWLSITVLYMLVRELMHEDVFSFWYFKPLTLNVIFCYILISFLLFFKGAQLTLSAVAIAGILVSVSCVFSFGAEFDKQGYRLSFFGLNPNELSSNLTFGCSCLLINFAFKQRLNKFDALLLITCSLLISDVILATGTRFSVIALFVLFVLASWLYFEQYKSLKLSVLIAIIPAVSVFLDFCMLSAIRSPTLERFLLIENGLNNNLHDLGGRTILWANAVEGFFLNPVFGNSMSGFSSFSQEMFGTTARPHNVVLELLSAFGAIGFALTTVFFVSIFPFSRALTVKDKLILSILFIPVFFAAMSLNINSYKSFWFSLAIFLFFCISFNKRDNKSEP